MIYRNKTEMNYVRAWCLIIIRLTAGLFLFAILFPYLVSAVNWIVDPFEAKSVRNAYLENLKKSSPDAYNKFIKTDSYKRFMSFTTSDSVVLFYNLDPKSPIYREVPKK